MRVLLLSALVLLPLLGAAAAKERPDAVNMGKLLAYTVNCSCVAGEKEWILDIYRRVFSDAYGESFANAFQAPLRDALKDGWDNQMGLCKRICALPVTRELQLTLAHADGGDAQTPVDGSAIRAILGPPPASEPAVVYVSPTSGETATIAVQPAPTAEDAATPEAAEAAVRPVSPSQPSDCVDRNDAGDCTPPQGEAPDVVLVPVEAVDTAPVATAAAGSAADSEIPATPQTTAAPEQEDVAPPATGTTHEAGSGEAESSSTAVSSAKIEALYEITAGDPWSAAICRTSPARPECRKPGSQ